MRKSIAILAVLASFATQAATLQCDTSTIKTMQPDGTYTPFAKGELPKGKIQVITSDSTVTFVVAGGTPTEQRLDFIKDYSQYRNDSGFVEYNKEMNIFTMRTAVNGIVQPGVSTPVEVYYHCK